MLSSFITKSVFYNVKAVIHSDCERREADLTLLVGGRIVGMQRIHWHEADTPEKAESFLRKDMGERGTIMEYWHWLHNQAA